MCVRAQTHNTEGKTVMGAFEYEIVFLNTNREYYKHTDHTDYTDFCLRLFLAKRPTNRCSPEAVATLVGAPAAIHLFFREKLSLVCPLFIFMMTGVFSVMSPCSSSSSTLPLPNDTILKARKFCPLSDTDMDSPFSCSFTSYTSPPMLSVVRSSK